MTKRLFDILVAGVALVLLSPLLLGVAAAVVAMRKHIRTAKEALRRAIVEKSNAAANASTSEPTKRKRK